MKKAIYILSVLLLCLVSCNKTEFESIEPKEVEPTGLVAVTMKIQIPEVELFAQTKADGQRSHLPDIQDMRVAVFGTSGYPQTYAKAEPIVSATNEAPADYASTNHKDGTSTDIYYFKVLLPVYEGEAHVHIIANGPKTIKFVDEDEDSIMRQMHSENGIGAFWARIVMPDGILTQLDNNGIMQTDDEGNFIPSDGTAHLFEDLVLVRNFAEVQLSVESGVENLTDISWTLVNVPRYGSVAPMTKDSYVDDYKKYEFNTTTWRMVNGTKTYDGYLFPGEPIEDPLPDGPKDNTIDYSLPTVSANEPLEHVLDPSKPLPSAFMYERTHPGSDKATCILVKAKYNDGTGSGFDDYYTYYRLDLTEETAGGYFPIYRNYMYQMKIHKVGNRGSKTIDDAMNRDSGGNVSQSTEARKLTDISDGESRLFVEYVEKNFTEGGKKRLWVMYVPDVTDTYVDENGDRQLVVDNTNVTVTVKDRGDALKEGTPATLTPISGSSVDGYYIYEFELNEQIKEKDLVSILQVKATNSPGDVTPEGKEKSTLYRDITLRVLKTMKMELKLVPQKVDAVQGKQTVLEIHLPEDLPESMFPLEFKIEDVNHTLYSTGSDGHGNSIIVPVKTDKSIVDGKTNSYYFIRTVNKDEYDSNDGVIYTQFKTNVGASATTVYVDNEYFLMESINLLNDGIYVNPVKAEVAFNVTSVEVEVEMDPDDQTKTWTVTGGNGVTITDIVDSEGNPFEGTPTGNGTFTMTFLPNNSATAAATRTATVTGDGGPHTVTITQLPMEFSITPETQTVAFNTKTARVTVHAEEGVSWTASITPPAGVTNGYSLSATSGTGTQELTVTLPVNGTTSQRDFTVRATMSSPSADASATISQRGGPAASYPFSYDAFGITLNNHSGNSSSTDRLVTVSLANATRRDTASGWGWNAEQAWNYVRMSDGGNNGSLTVTPVSGVKITKVEITYSGNETYRESNPTIPDGTSYNLPNNGSTGTWTVNSTTPVTMTFSTNGDSGKRISSIRVYCESAE